MSRVIAIFGVLLDVTVTGASSFLGAGEVCFLGLAGLVPLLMIVLTRLAAEPTDFEEAVAWGPAPSVSVPSVQKRSISAQQR